VDNRNNAETIAARITTEQQRLATEEAVETSLAAERQRLLVDGTDTETAEIEHRIEGSRTNQARIRERIALLSGQLDQAHADAKEADLDNLAARADRAREYGERLIADYAKRAPEVAALLGRMAAVEAVIEQSNGILHKAGRAVVESANLVRCRMGRRWTEKVMRDVDLQHPAHPFHGRATPMGGASIPGNDIKRMANIDGGGTCEIVMSVEVEEQRSDPGDFPDPLYETARLPGVGPSPPGHGIASLWDGDVPADAVAAVIAEIDGKPPITKPAKRAA